MIAGRDSPAQGAFRDEILPGVRAAVGIFLVLLIARCFLLEPSHVPTGSMAPHRLGVHLKIDCVECLFEFAVGIGDDGSMPSPLCPNCGSRQPRSSGAEPVAIAGDRLWIEKAAWNFVAPERWDEAVFYAPDAPTTPHLKRIVGLPGESVRIVDGDIFVDGIRARKNARQRHRTAVPVFDANFMPPEGKRPARWRFEVEGGEKTRVATLWKLCPQGGETPGPISLKRSHEPHADAAWDWAHYRHLCPIRDDYGPVRDFLAYDGAADGLGNVVGDLWFVARFSWRISSKIQLRLTTTEADIRVILDPGASDADDRQRVTINGSPLNVRWSNASEPLISDRILDSNRTVELSWVDRRLEFRIDGEAMFDPVDIETLPPRRPEERFRDTPAGFGVMDGELRILEFRLFRDVHYVNRLATQPVIGIGVREPFELPSDGYFMLGDDSAHSVDSRFWNRGSFVPRSALIGSPIASGWIAR
jgi:signal peptidase I